MKQKPLFPHAVHSQGNEENTGSEACPQRERNQMAISSQPSVISESGLDTKLFHHSPEHLLLVAHFGLSPTSYRLEG